MGNFRVVLEATGGHGCQRELSGDSKIYPCSNRNCPDCLVYEFVERLNKIAPVSCAELIHWPGDISEVRDVYVLEKKVIVPYNRTVNWETKETVPDHYVGIESAHRIRHGSFPGHKPKDETKSSSL